MALGPDPGRPQLGDDLSVKPRASELGPWSASLVWSSLGLAGAWDLDLGLPQGGMRGLGNGLTGDAGTQTQDKGHHGFRGEQGRSLVA